MTERTTRERWLASGEAGVAGGIIIFFAWQSYQFSDIASSPYISSSTATVAFLCIICALLSFVIRPKSTPQLALAASTTLFTGAAALLLINNAYSPLATVVWTLAVLSALQFGRKGLIGSLAASFIVAVYSLAVSDIVVIQDAPQMLAALALPLLIGGFVPLVGLIGPGGGSTHQVQTSQRLSSVVIDTISEGVVVIDAQRNIRLINPAAQQMIGWNEADATGINYDSVLKFADSTDKPVDALKTPISQAIARQALVSADTYQLITADASHHIPITITVSTLPDKKASTIVVFRDISSEQADERDQSEFISTASHEMRTPVASIEGYLGLALNPETATIDERARQYITSAHAASQHLGRLFQDLLDVTRADERRLRSEPRIVEVVSFVRESAIAFLQKAAEKNLKLVYRPRPLEDNTAAGEQQVYPLLYVKADPDHLRQIVDNLIDNAIKYTVRGEVVIDITSTDSHIELVIRDTGIGIPTEDLPHLFQKFYRVDNSETREVNGTGLGLYLCRRLAEEMDGRVRAESTYRQGSTFYLQLPRISGADAQRQFASQPALTPAHAPAEAPPAPPLPPPEAPPLQVPAARPATLAHPSRSAEVVPHPARPSIEQLSPQRPAAPAPTSVPTLQHPKNSLNDATADPTRVAREQDRVDVPDRAETGETATNH